MNLFSNQNPNPDNGQGSGDHLNTLNNHHPNLPPIEDVEVQEPHPETIKVIRRSFIFLVVIGLLVGAIVATGIIYILYRFDITGQPPQPSLEQVE
jgi:hypothetical protein